MSRDWQISAEARCMQCVGVDTWWHVGGGMVFENPKRGSSHGEWQRTGFGLGSGFGLAGAAHEA
jgi:hypothetical protein